LAQDIYGIAWGAMDGTPDLHSDAGVWQVVACQRVAGFHCEVVELAFVVLKV